MFFFLTLYMQTVLGYSPLQAGAAYLPLTFGIGISAGVGAKLTTKVGSRAVICAGALIASAGLLLLAQVPVHGSYPPNILPGLMLVAFGVGPVFVGVTAAANTGATTKQAGVVAAIMNSSQQVGGALGLAIFSAIVTSRSTHLLTTGASVHTAANRRLRPRSASRSRGRRRRADLAAHRQQDAMDAGHAAAVHDTTTTPEPIPTRLGIGLHPTN
jgi:MFS family permease